ncbi:MAG: hypothetical protein J6C86_09065 [Bacteroidaceae bacterium]|nr:hypothetical protein [Bacteroidaceae bacterium]
MKLFLATSLLLTLSTSICAQEYGYGDGSILMEPTSNENTNPNGYRTYAFISTRHKVEYFELILPFADEYGYRDPDIRCYAPLEWYPIDRAEVNYTGALVDDYEFLVAPTVEEDKNSWCAYKFRVNSSTEYGEYSWCGYGVPYLYIYVGYIEKDTGTPYVELIPTEGKYCYYK